MLQIVIYKKLNFGEEYTPLYRSFIRLQADGEDGHGEALWQVARSGTTFSLEWQKITTLLIQNLLSLLSG